MADFNQDRANVFDLAMQGGLSVNKKPTTASEQQQRLSELSLNPAGKHLREYDLLHSSLSVKYKQSILKNKINEDIALKNWSQSETSKQLEKAVPHLLFLSPAERSMSKSKISHAQ